MRLMLERIRWRMSSFMMGRYGVDSLFFFLYALAMFFWLLSLFLPMPIFSILYAACIFYSLFRYFSKNIAKRRQELLLYEKMTEKPRRTLRCRWRQWKERKTHRYYKCKCGTFLRVPKGQGKIKIHCKKCGAYMIKKS